MVKGIRAVEEALGSSVKMATPSERGNRAVARRGLVAGRDILKGEIFTENNLVVRRPDTGIPAMAYYDWLGQPASRNILKGEAILP